MHKTGPRKKEEVKYDTGNIVLGKVRGYPPWPGMVVDSADIPSNILAGKPPGKKFTFYCVLFFPMGDYAWLRSKEMSTLKKREMEMFLADDNKKRNRDLCEGYRIALDPKPFLETLKEDQVAIPQELEERGRDAEVDQVESEPDDDQDDDSRADEILKATATPKKRKRESDVEPKPKKPKAKKDTIESTKKKGASGKGGNNGVNSKTMVESEDEGDNAEEEADDEGAGPSKKTSPPPSKKVKRDKDEGDDSKTSTDPQADQVRQTTFLSNKALPKSELPLSQLPPTSPTIPESVPPPPRPSTLRSLPSSLGSKRKCSGLDDTDSQSMSGPLATCQRSSDATALYALGVKVDRMTDTFAAHFSSREKARSRNAEPSPTRQETAAIKFQKLEKNLTDDQMVAILNLFETFPGAASMFLTIDEANESLRWAWLSNKLRGLGFPPLPPRDQTTSAAE